MDLKGLFEALYSKFLLRDVVAKALPGFILISIFWGMNAPDNPFYFEPFTEGSSLLHDLVVFAVSWIAGIGIQSFGVHTFSKFQILRIEQTIDANGNCLEDLQRWSQLKTRFTLNSDDVQRSLVERMALIKEASGIGGLSCLISGCVLIMKAAYFAYSGHQTEDIFRFYLSGPALLLLGFFLIRMNHRFWEIQVRFMEDFADSLESQNASKDNETLKDQSPSADLPE